jgi:hypothetical protein
MRHPELMLSASGARVAIEFMQRKLREFQETFPEFPMSCLLAQLALESPHVPENQRAAAREMPYILSLIKERPIFWELDVALASAMLATDPPEDPGLSEFRLPHPAIWVSVPPIFDVWNDETGFHKVEGFYLAEDWVPSRKKLLQHISAGDVQLHDESVSRSDLMEAFNKGIHESPESILERAILVMIVGESRTDPVKDKIVVEGQAFEVVTRDDALISFWIYTEDPSRQQQEKLPHSDSARRTVTNLLMAIQADYITQERVVPKKPKSPKKVARASRRGASFSEYSVIRLGKRYAADNAPSRGKGGKPGEQRDRIIRGHWAHYWVLGENVGHQVQLAIQPREGKAPLFKIRKWIKPVIIGNPPIKTYLVK